MKRYILFLLIVCNCIVFAGCDINVDFKNIQDTEISVTFPKERVTLNKETKAELEKSSLEFEETDTTQTIKTNVSIMNMNEKIDGKYKEFLNIVKNTQDEFTDMPITIETSLAGMDFGGTLSAKLTFPDDFEDFTLNILSDNEIALHEGIYEKYPSYSNKDIKNNTLFFTTTVTSIEHLKTTIEQASNNESVKVTYYIKSNKDAISSIKEINLYNLGYELISKGNNYIEISKSYEDNLEFNNIFDLDTIKLFGIIQRFEVDSISSLYSTFNLNGTVFSKDLIPEYIIEVKLKNNGTANYTDEKGKVFQWNISEPQEIQVKSTKFHFGILLMTSLIIFSMAFIIIVLYRIRNGLNVRLRQ